MTVSGFAAVGTKNQYLQKRRLQFKVGSRGSEPGCFTWPRGIAVAPDNSIVVADSSNHRVQVIMLSYTFFPSFGAKNIFRLSFLFGFKDFLVSSQWVVQRVRVGVINTPSKHKTKHMLYYTSHLSLSNKIMTLSFITNTTVNRNFLDTRVRILR